MDSLLNDDDRPTKEVDEGSVISDKDAASEAEGLRKRLLDMQKKLQAGRVQPVVQATDKGSGGKRDRHRRSSSVDGEEREYRNERRGKEAERRRGRSESPPMSPYSALGPEGRPAGRTREQINRMGVDAALKLKGWEREEDKERKTLLARPGRVF